MVLKLQGHRQLILGDGGPERFIPFKDANGRVLTEDEVRALVKFDMDFYGNAYVINKAGAIELPKKAEMPRAWPVEETGLVDRLCRLFGFKR